jgi:hypothetical protein
MPIDPTEPETVEELLEREPGVEAPEADAAEQRTEIRQHRDLPPESTPAADADPADVAEQGRVVELDEDDYR